MQKKLVQSSLALTAAAALGLGGAFVAPLRGRRPAEVRCAERHEVQEGTVGCRRRQRLRCKGRNSTSVLPGRPMHIKDLEKKYENVVRHRGHQGNEAVRVQRIVGGAGYLVQSGSSAGACSTGFSGWDGAGNPIVLTAGHCAKIIEEVGRILGRSIVDETEQPSTAAANGGDGFVRSGQGVLGQWGYHKFGGELVAPDDPTAQPNEDDIDFAVINVDKSKYNVKTGVTDWSTARFR